MTNKTYTERDFPIHSRETAPDTTHAAIDWYQENFGMVPNLARVIAESPALLNSYWHSQLSLLDQSALNSQEMNIVQTIVAHSNNCQYCVAGHTAFGKTEFFKNTDEQLNAIRENKDFEDPKLNILREFTLQVLLNQGRISSAQLKTFLYAGYTRQAALDIVANIAVKVMSNYANQIAMTPIDEPFVPLAEGLAYQETRLTKTA